MSSEQSVITPNALSPIVSLADAIAMGALSLAFAVACGVIFLLVLRRERRQSAPLPPIACITYAGYIVGASHAVIVSPIAVAGWVQMISAPDATYTCEPLHASLATVPSPPAAVWATGITCGFLLFDCVNMVAFCSEWREQLGNVLYAIMWVHHLLSLLVWPYCVLTHRAAFFVSWMLATEVSNILGNVYNAYKLRQSHAPTVPAAVVTNYGIAWIVSFFAIRIVPKPYIVYAYYELLLTSGSCGLTPTERVLGIATVPLPLLLNTWWFYLMIVGAIQALRGGTESTSASSSDTYHLMDEAPAQKGGR